MTDGKQSVPLVDLAAELRPLRAEILSGFEAVLDKCNFILGDQVREFEASFSTFSDTKHTVAVANGTDALHLALRALDVGPGDQVLVPANTFIATAIGVSLAGATPVLVDVDPTTMLMDPALIEAAITPQTKVILPVHLCGRMMDLAPVEAIANARNLHLVEDAAQAHGARLHDRTAGSVGAIGCFSFYPGKNLGCFGDGGAVTTNDEQLHQKLLALRNYGSPKKYHHPSFGVNSRLDTLQAIVLNAKLPHLAEGNGLRYQHAEAYNSMLEGVGDLILPEIPVKGSHIFHLYMLRTKRRDELLAHLHANGVGAGIHYPTPLHLHGAYEYLGHKKGDFPVAEQLADEIVSLPLFPKLQPSQIAYVVDQIKAFF